MASIPQAERIPKAISQMRFHELPPEVIELDDLQFDLENWPALPEGTSEEIRLSDQAEREALERTINERWETIGQQILETGESMHSWLCRLRDDAAAAKEEERRVREIAKSREGRFARVKERVKYCLDAMGLKKIEGPSWRLRTQANGGVQSIEHDGITPIPVAYAAPIPISPQLLKDTLEDLFLMIPPDERPKTDNVLDWFFSGVSQEVPELQPDFATVREHLKRTGEVPAGFTVLPKGSHLRIE